jgi:uncharacterized protein
VRLPFAGEVAQMRVSIDEIKEGGLQRAWDLPRERVDAMVQGDASGHRARGPLHLEARLKKTGRRVLLAAKGIADLVAPCGRCLQPASTSVPLDFELTFVPADEVEATAAHGEEDAGEEPAGSFAPRTADEEAYTRKELDLEPVVREQLILALPPYPVCQEGCKGLCPVCGANLNERECGCDPKVPDPRWAGLEKFRK